jgi:hypothetical protein
MIWIDWIAGTVITKKQKRAKESKVTAMLNGPMLR